MVKGLMRIEKGMNEKRMYVNAMIGKEDIW